MKLKMRIGAAVTGLLGWKYIEHIGWKQTLLQLWSIHEVRVAVAVISVIIIARVWHKVSKRRRV